MSAVSPFVYWQMRNAADIIALMSARMPDVCQNNICLMRGIVFIVRCPLPFPSVTDEPLRLPQHIFPRICRVVSLRSNTPAAVLLALCIRCQPLSLCVIPCPVRCQSILLMTCAPCCMPAGAPFLHMRLSDGNDLPSLWQSITLAEKIDYPR